MKQGKREARTSKAESRKDRDYHERLLAEHKRANDLKELELMRSATPAPVEPTPAPLQMTQGGSWWAYSDPSKKKRRG
ncbi:hypothetical protein [Rhodococcoides fascians]|uniref:hypothetical protein n=1 Tax=Rhodococcoides fascians TaxID=1828 RepID=UPI003672D21E